MSPGTLETPGKLARRSIIAGQTDKKIDAASLGTPRQSINAGPTRKGVDLDSAQGAAASAARRSSKSGSAATASGGAPATIGTGKFCPIHKGEPLVEPPVVEEVPADFCEGEEPPHYGFGPILIIGFLKGQLERLHVFSLLPDANLVSCPYKCLQACFATAAFQL